MHPCLAVHVSKATGGKLIEESEELRIKGVFYNEEGSAKVAAAANSSNVCL